MDAFQEKFPVVVECLGEVDKEGNALPRFDSLRITRLNGEPFISSLICVTKRNARSLGYKGKSLSKRKLKKWSKNKRYCFYGGNVYKGLTIVLGEYKNGKEL